MGARKHALGTHERAQLATDVRAALGGLVEMGTREGVDEALAVNPWLAAVPAVTLLREALRIYPFEARALRTMAISEKWEQRLQIAVDQLCRTYGSATAGAEELLRFAWCGIPEAAARRGREPFSLGGFAVLMRKRAHTRRRQRGRPAEQRRAESELERLRAKGLA